MKDISGLVQSLNVNLNWNKARSSCFIKILMGLIRVATVNLKQIALAFDSPADVNSRYRRIQRFFALFEMDFRQIAFWIFYLFFKPNDKCYLIIDRTNWFRGKNKINVFMLSVAYEGIAIPLFWKLLPTCGNSNFEQQKELISHFINNFGKDRIEGILADREFASGKLLKWLDKQGIFFYLRIKENTMVHIRNEKFLHVCKLFRHLNPKSKSVFGMAVWIYGQKVYLAGSRSERGELMIVATNGKPKNAIEKYLRRWEVENLFQSLKGRGFKFEETHLTNLDRLAKLTALLAVGFSWAHKVGEWRAKIKPIIWKNFKEESRPQSSYFRYGLDLIREIIFQTLDKENNFRRCLNYIYPVSPANLEAFL
jgi:hypothetical protein